MTNWLKTIWKRWKVLLLVVIVLSVLASLPRLLAPPASTGISADIKPFSLDGYQRLLVVAPHCDDETLGSAGLIMAAQRAGMEVRVVIATNGDGFFFATAQDFHKIYPSAGDYIRMGEIRQQESLAALKILGVQKQQVTFLSYPDRGTPSEWNDHWSKQDPYRSPYSQDTHSPYPITYNGDSVYAGEDVLADFMSIMENYRPDLIVYPNPDDVHPDHWGVNVFTRLAIAEINHKDPTFSPFQLTYLVHRPDFPTVRGLKPAQSLVPPPALLSIYPDWFRFDLTPADVQRKGQAVQAYKSQLPLLHGLLESFVRSNELFASVDNGVLPVVKSGSWSDPSTWKNALGQTILPVERDPVGDFFVRRAFPSADLVAAYLAMDTVHDLWICSQTRDEISTGLTYQLRIKALDAQSVLAFQATTG